MGRLMLFKYRLLKILSLMWQFLQYILGFGLYLIFDVSGKIYKRHTFNDVTYVFCHLKIAITFGPLIFLDKTVENFQPHVIKHEFGHSIQSRILGPLYLIIVGIPGGIFFLLNLISPYFDRTYYTRFPETWADWLVHIKRG